MADTQTRAQAHTRTEEYADDTQVNKSTDFPAVSVRYVWRHSSLSRPRFFSLEFCAHFLFSYSGPFYFVLLFSLCFLLFCPFQRLPHRNWYRHPWPAAIKLESRCLWHAYILTCARITHDTIWPQEKLWARTGRKTLENQDTIWHLWSLNDFLLGVGLHPTGKSQKTGRENYIRENVYAAHSAPLLFAPQMSDYSSTLNFWGEGDSFHH